MGNTAYTKIITLLLTTLMVCGGYSYEAKAQEFNSDEAHSYATYVVVRQKRDKFQAGDTIRWRHNLRLNIGVPSLMLFAEFLTSPAYGEREISEVSLLHHADIYGSANSFRV